MFSFEFIKVCLRRLREISATHEFSAGIPVITNAEIFSLLLLHVLACSNYASIVIG